MDGEKLFSVYKFLPVACAAPLMAEFHTSCICNKPEEPPAYKNDLLAYTNLPKFPLLGSFFPVPQAFIFNCESFSE